MLFGKKPPLETPEQLILATQSEPFMDRDIRKLLLKSSRIEPYFRQYSDYTSAYGQPSLFYGPDVHKISAMTVVGWFAAISLIGVIGARYITKDPWNPPEVVQSLQKIGDFNLSGRDRADGQLTELETHTRSSCANRTNVKFSTPRTRIGDAGPTEEPVVMFADFGGENAASNAYTLCLIKENVERLCDGDSVKHTAETLQGYFWSLDPMNGFEHSPTFAIMQYGQAMQPNNQFNALQKEIGINPNDANFPKSKADPLIVMQVKNLIEQGYLRKSDLFFDLRGAPTGAKGLFDDVKQGKSPPCEKSA
ncbi:MAG: hypothetical protein RL145_694 [Pseudomonadota bacterium]